MEPAGSRGPASLLEAARHSRPRSSRAAWIAAAIVGGVCAIGFVAMLLATPDDQAKQTLRGRQAPESEAGLTTGLIIGAAVGAAGGFAVGRRYRRHSSASKP